MAGIGLGTFGAIVLYQLVRGAGGGVDAEGSADAVPVEYRGDWPSRGGDSSRGGGGPRSAPVVDRRRGKRRRR